MKYIQLSVLAALTLTGCFSSGEGRFSLSISDVEGEFQIRVKNESDQPVVVHDQLVGGPGESPFIIQIRNASGEIMSRCGSLDYFEVAREIVVTPHGGVANLAVPVSTVAVTHCLDHEKPYTIRVGLADLSGEVQYSQWTSFRPDVDGG